MKLIPEVSREDLLAAIARGWRIVDMVNVGRTIDPGLAEAIYTEVIRLIVVPPDFQVGPKKDEAT